MDLSKADQKRRLQRSSINDVTVLGGGGQLFCDDMSEALVIKSVLMVGWGGVNNSPNLREVIMNDPLDLISFDQIKGQNGLL